MKLKAFRRSIRKEAKYLKNNINSLKTGKRLAEHIENLAGEKKKQEFELKKAKRTYDYYNLRNKGLIDVESRFLSSQSRMPKNGLTASLRDEIHRLMTVIEAQRETIEKTPFINGELLHMRVPTLVKSRNPLRLTRNFVRYKKEQQQYKLAVKESKKVKFHFRLGSSDHGITVERDGETSYKGEHIEEHNTYLKVGEKFLRQYYLADIPAYLSPYVFFKLLTSALPFTLSIFTRPTPSAELLKKARQRHSVLEMQQNDRLKQGKLRDQQLDKNIEEAMSFIEELVHESEKGVIYALYLQLEAQNESELIKSHKELQNITGAMDLTLNQYTFGQKKAFKNFMPFNVDHVKENRILQSTAVSYLLPFVSKQFSDPNGIFMGASAFDNSLVFIDPFTSRNNNVNIFGVSGSGKSVTSKVLMSRLYLRGIQMIIIDPEGEYASLARDMGGEVIRFSRENGINPFYINSSRESDVLDHISTLKTFFKFFIPVDHYDGALLDEVLIKLYDRDTPQFDTLLELLGKHPMKKDLSVLSKGSLRGVFNSKRKLQLNSDIIVLDLHDLKKDEKREPAMYLLTSLIWNLVNSNTDKRRMLVIDEAHKLLVEPEVAVFYRELVKQARKRNVGVVSITQDVEDFLKNEYGKAIITNSETKILLKQSYATLSDIGTIYPMTDEEKQQLGHLGIGEVVLFREGEHMRLNIVVLPSERAKVFTSPTPNE